MEEIMVSCDKVKDYLFNSLKEGRESEIKICFMAHNSKWQYYEALAQNFTNISIDVFGSSTMYLNRFNKLARDDYDIIILNSNNGYEDYELSYLSEMAQTISRKKDKKVSLGYCFYVPDDDNNQLNHQEALVITYENNLDYKCHLIGENKDTLSYFFEFVVKIHDQYDSSKIKKVIR